MALRRIKLEKFKSFEGVELPLSNLNILAGGNSVGKSSVIQALLLYKQNHRELLYTNTIPSGRGKIKRFQTNGNDIKVGDEGDLLYSGAEDDTYKISLSSRVFSSELTFCNEKGWEIFFPNEVGVNDRERATDIYDLVLHLEKIRHISSNRIGPAITYELSKLDIENNSLGNNGEYTAHYLSVNNYKELPIKKLVHEKSVTNYLLENVSNWMAEISENIYVNAKVINEAQKAAITYEYSHGFIKTSEIIPLNVGYGITHVLPIITQLLIAEPNDILILENPEAQLHPKAQAKVAKLIALAAANGVQIILETHSDHILNGIRVATKKRLISSEQTNLFFFKREPGHLEVAKTQVKILEDGSLDNWPEGMFDEWDNQLDQLLW
ncbi:AAA family ATPase [Vibrio sp. WZ-1]|uniref:AAA family ATPase n=1 Tax=Vibrio sp. WZ-1 TaxID=3454501 RepID=UPI003F84D8C6